MGIAILLLVIASLIGAGSVVPHQRWLTLFAAAGALFEMQWLLLTLIARTALPDLSPVMVFTVGSSLAVIGWATYWRNWRRPVTDRDQWFKEGVVLLVVLLTLASAHIISFHNGEQADGSWLTHGFFNGDTVTLAALTQGSLETNGLLNRNPFAANSTLEYPTLLHAGVATFISGIGQTANWLSLWPIITYAQILITVPLFFLIWDVVHPKPKQSWQSPLGLTSRWWPLLLPVILILYVMALSWDSYVYLQSHFLLLASFLLLVATLHTADRQTGVRQLCPVAAAAALTLALMLSNAVTGTAALILALVFAGQRVLERSRPPLERGSALLTGVIFIGIFLFATPGNAAWSTTPHFSYTAATGLLALAPVTLALLVGVLLYASRYRFITSAAMALGAAAVVVYLFSDRNIIIENASRFIYHAVLVAFPLLAFPAIRASIWLKRELRNTTHPLAENITVWTAALIGLAIFTTPALASLASTHDNLLFKDAQRTSALEREAYAWLQQNTNPTDVILASPNEPWSIPLFTGRTLVRTNYWLSLADPLTDEVTAAFNGNLAAQEVAAGHANYIVLTRADEATWPLYDGGTPVFGNTDVKIFRGAKN